MDIIIYFQKNEVYKTVILCFKIINKIHKTKNTHLRMSKFQKYYDFE